MNCIKSCNECSKEQQEKCSKIRELVGDGGVENWISKKENEIIRLLESGYNIELEIDCMEEENENINQQIQEIRELINFVDEQEYKAEV